MYANSSVIQASNNIPEWKKKLLMKKRAGSSINIEERHSGMLSESNCDGRSTHSEFDFQEVSPLKTVTIGNWNVELRTVPSDSSDRLEYENEDGQDLQYGPGIVDRLRERFLNMGAKKQRRPVRRFSSLENLPCSFVRPFKLNPRPIRQNGFKVGSGNHCGNVKKAQSMETLIYSPQDPPIFSAGRRRAPSLAPIPPTCEMEEPSSVRSSIKEDELPKPDTVKHVKKLFEASLRNDKESLSEADKCVAPRPLNANALPSSDDCIPLPLPTDPLQESSDPPRVTHSSSIVFDFRGKDVKPNIAFRPTQLNGEDDWDEMDIGADLPAVSGILFAGENVKVGRGAILETRNKKLTIQFDDQATSTFEYPSENASPSPVEDSSFNTLLALGSLANSRLSHYASQNVPSNIDFELGISQPNHRLPMNAKTDPGEKLDEDPTLPAIVPTKPEDASGWSSTNSTDILF